MSRRGRETVAFSLFSFQDIIMSVTGIMILVTLILALELIQYKETSQDQRTRELVHSLQDAVADAQQWQEAVLRNQARMKELQDSLSRGATRLSELAGIDLRRLRDEVADLEQQNENLDRELTDLERQSREAERQEEETKRLQEELAEGEPALEQLIEEIQQKRESLEELKKSKRVIYNRSPGDEKTPWLVEITDAELIAAEAGMSGRPQTFSEVPAFAVWLAQRDPNAEYFVLLVKPEGIAKYAAARQVLRRGGFDMGYDLLAADQEAIDPEKGAAVE